QTGAAQDCFLPIAAIDELPHAPYKNIRCGLHGRKRLRTVSLSLGELRLHDSCGNTEGEYGAVFTSFRAAAHLNCTLVFLDKIIGHPKTQARTNIRFSAKKRLKDARQVCGGNTMTKIHDGDVNH